MARSRYKGWGYVSPPEQTAHAPVWVNDIAKYLTPSITDDKTHLAFGNGRSYGDSCLNSEGELIDTASLNRFIQFDAKSGLITVESGVTLASMLNVIVPRGWFLPVTPGTSFVTVGGAIANDVHGKNHHCDGTFGRFIRELILMRSNGEVLHCNSTDNTALLNATIGGLGLTGVISQATIQLIPITSSNMDVSFHLFTGVEQFRDLAQEYNEQSRYTVAWLDCASTGKNFARGVFMAANHAKQGELNSHPIKTSVGIPVNLPRWVLNSLSIKCFNQLYYWRHQSLDGTSIAQPMNTFFYPLDAVNQWNRIYGRRGFHQYQFVIPFGALAELETVLRKIVHSGMGSFLAVLKEFGDIPSPGMLSFPREGVCLALDFADRGNKTIALIEELDAIVSGAGGAVYPAKDRLMSASSFKQYFPQHKQFAEFIDPGFSSDFWSRVS